MSIGSPDFYNNDYLAKYGTPLSINYTQNPYTTTVLTTVIDIDFKGIVFFGYGYINNLQGTLTDSLIAVYTDDVNIFSYQTGSGINGCMQQDRNINDIRLSYFNRKTNEIQIGVAKPFFVSSNLKVKVRLSGSVDAAVNVFFKYRQLEE